MRRHHKYLRWMLCAAAFLVVAGGRLTAQPPTPHTGLKVEVSDVSDERHGDEEFGGLSVVLDIAGVPGGIERVRVPVATARDEAGNDLRKPPNPGNGWGEKMQDEDELCASAEMKNPPRQSQKLARFKGEIELLILRRDPLASLVVADWRKYLSRPLPHAVLKKNKISLRVLSAAQFNALPHKERVDLTGGMTQMSANLVLLLTDDPDVRLALAEFVAPDGSAIESISFSENADGRIINFQSPLPQNARLRLLIATPKATVKVPFDFADIPLP